MRYHGLSRRPVAFLRVCAIAALTIGPAALTAQGTADRPGSERTEILWDTWGVLHIFARAESDLFRGFGYAQMASHAELLLTLYARARGRAAEYWGEQYLESDRYVRTMGIPGRAAQWYAAQSPRVVIAGDTFYGAAEFARPVRAKALLAYGNATRPGSRHRGDQLELFAKQQMRDVWRTRAEIAAHLDRRDAF